MSDPPHDPVPGRTPVTAVVSVVFTILYIQVQAQGLGYILSVATDGRVSFELGTLVLLVVAAGYLVAGGLRAVYWTDVIQGVWMYAGGGVWAPATNFVATWAVSRRTHPPSDETVARVHGAVEEYVYGSGPAR